MHMKQVIVGTYRCGDDQYQVVLREGNGADFFFQPGDILHGRVKIGADVENWRNVVTALMHEAIEASIARICCRYTPDDEYGRDSASYVFVLRHEQFSDACARAGMMLSDCLPDLSVAWKKWQEKKRKATHDPH